MKEVTLQLDIDEEINQLAQHVQATWNNVKEIHSVLRELQVRAAHDTRALFDQFEPSEVCHSLSKARQELVSRLFQDEDEKALCGSYDSIASVLDQAYYKMRSVREAGLGLDGPWDFSSKMAPHHKAILKKYPSLAHATPKANPDEHVFQGSYIGAVRSFEFPERITAGHVAHEIDGHGKGAAYVLLGAAYAHFMGINEHLNTKALVRDIKELFNTDIPNMTFGKVVTGAVDNKLLQTLITLSDEVYTEDQFKAAVVSRKEFSLMSPEDRQKVCDENPLCSMEELDRQISEDEKKTLKALRRVFSTNRGHGADLSGPRF